MSTPREYDTGIAESELDPERPRVVETPWGTMGLYVVDGEVLCSQAFCPHLEGPLFQGTVSGSEVTCPWHQWRYDLRTGERLHPPPAAPEEGRSIVLCEVSFSEGRTIVLRRPAPRG